MVVPEKVNPPRLICSASGRPLSKTLRSLPNKVAVPVSGRLETLDDRRWQWPALRGYQPNPTAAVRKPVMNRGLAGAHMIGGKGCDARATLVSPDPRMSIWPRMPAIRPRGFGLPGTTLPTDRDRPASRPASSTYMLYWSIRFSHEDTEMTQEVKLRKVGGSIAATLPKEMADRLKLTAGDTVIALETDRGILLTPYDPDTEEALSIAAEVGRTYRNALRELAK